MDAHMTRRQWGATLWLTVAILSAALPARSSNPVRGGRLVVSLRSEPKHFNPVVALDRPTRLTLGLLMADLVRIDRETQGTFANLARSWSLSADGRTFTVELREGIRFSDGHPMSSDDVVFSFEAYLEERNGSPQRELLRIGGEPIKVRKLDPLRIQFELAEPYAAGERLFDSFFVLPRHKLEAAHQNGSLSEVWPLLTDPSEVVGLGPFRLKEVVPGERIVLERNPFYWKRDDAGAALPYLDELVLEIVPAEETEVLRLKRGTVHLIEGLSPAAFAQLSRLPTVRARDLGAGFEYNLLVFNLNELETGVDEALARKQEWFRNEHFRRAVSRGIDRAAIVRLVYGGRGTPLVTHVTPGNRNWIADDLEPDPYSIETALRELREGGFRLDAEGRLVDDRGTRVRFSILTSASNEERKKMAAILQEDLLALGIEVTITTLEFRAFVDRLFQSKDYDACVLGLGGADADPNPDMSFLLSSGAMHVWRLGARSPLDRWQEEIDGLMTEQMTVLDRMRRKTMYQRVQRLVAEHLPFISLASPHVLLAHDAGLGNLRPGVLPPYALWNADQLYLNSEAKAGE